MKRSIFEKLFDWEYWPTFMFYIPNVPYAAYLALRAKSLVFFSATNPAIQHSGNGSESKFKTIELLPKAYRPNSIFIKANKPIEKVFLQLKNHNLKYPLIIKPDIGFKGLLVKQLKSDKDLVQYHKNNSSINLIVQEFIDYKNECGIFYHRFPDKPSGKITSITLKKYLIVIGDGSATLLELIKNNVRAKNYLDLLILLHKNNLNLILPKGEGKTLSIIGNHSKGAQFINGNHLIDLHLENTIDTIAKQIPGWFYGRLDIKFNSFEELKQLQNFKIIEINGIISEPTHIYDSTSISYFNALKEIRKHWKYAYKIAVINHSKFNVKYDKVSLFIKSLLNIRNQMTLIKK